MVDNNIPCTASYLNAKIMDIYDGSQITDAKNTALYFTTISGDISINAGTSKYLHCMYSQFFIRQI